MSQHVAVTGANRGIGRAIAARFLREGWDVWTLVRAPASLKTESSGKGVVHPVVFDAANETSVLEAAERLNKEVPRLDGEETFRQLRQIDPAIRVILMSGFNQQEAISRFTGKGLAGFVQKPFELATLAVEIRRVLESPNGNS